MVKKALIIGINYQGNAALQGCINDCVMEINMLKKRYGYTEENVRFLADKKPDIQLDNPHPVHELPTFQGIIRGLQWLIKGASDGDTLYLHYSGHGVNVTDYNYDEVDGKDEALVPCDYQTAGFIVDDYLRKIFIDPLPSGVKVRGLIDCCHSGTMLDLPYTYKGPYYTSYGVKNRDFTQTGQLLRSKADIIVFSGARDDQEAADANIQGQRVGAMSHAFIHALDAWNKIHKNNPTVAKLLSITRNFMTESGGKYDQVPQINCSHEFSDKDLYEF